MAIGIFTITFDRNKIEVWSCHRSTEDRIEHPDMSTFTGQYIERSGEFLDGYYSDDILRALLSLI